MHCEIVNGDALMELRAMAPGSVQCCITSPPYWGLRDYGVDGQLGLEASPFEYVDKMVEIFAEVRRVLKDDGTLWLNLGDSYAGSWGAQSRGTGSDPKNPAALKGSGLSKHQILSAPAKNPARNPSSFRRDRADVGGLRHKDAGLKPKDLIGVPWRVALALQADGWWLRSDIIWHKPNPMPESITDRPTKSHEYIFLLAKSETYYYDSVAIKEPHKAESFARALRARSGGKFIGESEAEQSGLSKGDGYGGEDVDRIVPPDGRNKRSVWTVGTEPYAEAHFATFPPKLIEPCVIAGCPAGGTILDPFAGAGTTGLVAKKHNRRFIGIELKPEYCEMAERRLSQEVLAFAG